MKTTKLILGLVLCFALFNGCSSEPPFEEAEETSKIEEAIVANKTTDSKEEKTDTKDNLQYYPWDNSNDSSALYRTNETPLQTVFIQITYMPGLSFEQRYNKRVQYQDYVGLTNYIICLNNYDREVWFVDNLECENPCATGKLEAIDNDSDISRAILQNDCND